MNSWLERLWYGQSLWRYLFIPLSLMYRLVFFLQKRQWQKEAGLLERPPVPVIIVGNITVGGTGKTPLTLALLEYLQNQGFRPGVISRGYGGHPPTLPHVVEESDDPSHTGDEPLLIRRRSQCPVVVDPDRRRALDCLLQRYSCDVVVSDDGLQHHRLFRDIEIVVIDGQRRLGNRWCLPAGPLREPPDRLNSVDFVLSNGFRIPEADHLMELKPVRFREIGGEKTRPVESFAGKEVYAVAGIGNPGRFFSSLESLQIIVHKHIFPDHHQFQPGELNFGHDKPLLMTEKDAIKCQGFTLKNAWYLQVNAVISPKFYTLLEQKLFSVQNRQKCEADGN